MTTAKTIHLVHPFLLGLFPVLFLYARNVSEVRFAEIFMPLGLVSAGVAIAYALLIPLIRDRWRRAPLLSVLVLLFFLHGPVVSLLSEVWETDASSVFTPDRVMAGVLPALLIASTIVLLKTRRDLGVLNKLITQVAAALLLIQIAVAGYAWMERGEGVEPEAEPPGMVLSSDTSPDIYYLILDGYARSDILRDIYSYDNQAYIRALTDRGFYVAERSHANYNSTAQSLSSTLNMDYLHRFLSADRSEFSRMPTAVMLENNRVMNHLQRYGYASVSFSTGYAPTEIEFADFYYSPGWALSEFQNHLLNSTPIPFWTAGLKTQFDLHRERLEFMLNKLADLSEVPSPKFVFAHISCPHPPFVFGSAGEPIERDWPFSFSDGSHYFEQGGNPDEYLVGYRGQVRYISDRIIPIIDSIVASAADPPVIILQADHGPGSRLDWQSQADTDLNERFAILNAYLAPGLDSTSLYPEISPVNSFRVVLNQYFGTEFQYLPDRCYFTTWIRPYIYHDVTDSL